MESINTKKRMSLFNHKISIDRIACPLHVLHIKKGMKAIQAGETLKITGNAYVLPELLSAAKQIGREVSSNDKNEIFIVK